MEVYIGEIVNTHGIKGELRIISNFKYKEQVFKTGFTLFIGRRREPLVITSYRKHKNYDMVTFEGITDINDAIGYKGDRVYINRDDIDISGYVNEDIIGLAVYSKDKYIGKVENIVDNKAHEILLVKNDTKTNLIPFVDEFIEKVDIESKKIYINEIEGLINED